MQGAKQLLWVNNTDSDVFRMGPTGAGLLPRRGPLVLGAGFHGPWTFATPTLPDDFKKIPLEHERSRVLASVPGTPQAAEAVLLAQIPQTARVSKTVQAPEVAYQGGTPEFQPIEKTTVQRAVNTDKDILKVGDLYYMCFQGVWFMSKTPTGPWEVTGEVPKQIYEIPVSSPSHAVTYVTVEESNDDAVVFATAAAFTGVMVAWGCAVWGTGYYYPPYVGYGGGYPYYRPSLSDLRVRRLLQPLDRRVHARRGGLRSVRRGRRRPALQPADRHLLARRRGLRPVRRARRRVRPTTRAPARTARPGRARTSTAAGEQTGVQRGDQWATTARYTNNVTGKTTRVTRERGRRRAISRTGAGGDAVARTGSGDVYAGHDGNVYRKQGDSWQKYGDGGWNSVDRPTPAAARSRRRTARRRAAHRRVTARRVRLGFRTTASQVNRDSAARAEGAQRTRDSGQVRSGASSRSGSYRASGGRAGAAAGGGAEKDATTFEFGALKETPRRARR